MAARFLRITLSFLAILTWATTANAATYYVRTSGSDSNSGQSPADAFATIKKSATTVQAGDTVYVGAGTYTDKAEPAADGTSSNPIHGQCRSTSFNYDGVVEVVMDIAGSVGDQAVFQRDVVLAVRVKAILVSL